MASSNPDGSSPSLSPSPHPSRQLPSQHQNGSGVAGVHARVRKATDGELVYYVYRYTVDDPTCHPKFRDYFAEAIVEKWPTEGAPLKEWIDWFNDCDAILRNPEITLYGLSDDVLRKIEEYTLFNDLYPDEGDGPTGLPIATIPEQYRPDTATATTTTVPPKTPAKTPGALYPTPLTQDTTQRPKTPGQPIHFVKPIAPGNPPTPISIHEPEIPVDTTGPDFTQPSYDQYDAARPPLGIFLETINAFLENENSQTRNFSQQLSDVIDYLQWLGSGKDRRIQLGGASEYTKFLYQTAIEKIGTHLKRDRQQAIVTPVVFTDSPISFRATRTSRLDHLTNIHDFPLPSKRGVPDKSNLLPYSITPSPEKKPIQGMLLENPEHYEQFLADEGKIWLKYSEDLSKLDDMEIPTELSNEELENNLAAIESDIYVQYTKARGPSATWKAGDPIGWTIIKQDETGESQIYITTGKDPETGEDVLHPMDLSDPKDWASVRGVRRAGLQLMLRNYRTNENDFVYYDSDTNGQRSRRLVLPIPVSTIRKVMDRVDGRQWIPPSIFDDKELVWNHWETFSFSDRFRVYTATAKAIRAKAYYTATERHIRDVPWVTLPKNIINGGPFIWRGLGPKEQTEEDLLKQCLAVRDFVAMCWNKAPRPLLANMIQFLTAAERTGSETFPEPETFGQVGVLAFDESEYAHTAIAGTRQRAGYRYINDEDIQWLKFLGSGCVNKRSWKGRLYPDHPKTTYRLFHIFAKRVLRLLEDPNPEGILYSSASIVTVEQLLKVINAGTNGKSAVNKYEFSVFEACQHLDRLDQTGHIDFKLDPACYGRVQRPVYDFYPEHRIAYSPGSGRTTLHSGDKLFPKMVHDWVDICLDPHTGQTKEPPARINNAVDNFYRALAYRLGFTIFHLRKKAVARRADARAGSHKTPPYAWLHDSIKKFNAVHEELLKSLLNTRPNPPAPYGDTWKDVKSLVQDVEFLDGGHADPSTNSLISKRAHLADNNSAIVHLRNKIISEVASNNTLLAPARAKTVVNPSTGDIGTILTRAISWKFGSLSVRQEGWRRQYFSVNRYPVYAQSEATAKKITEDKYFIDGVDPKQVFDYQAADPIHAFFQREKLRPYIEEPVKYREGPAIYPVGDTRHQRRVVEDHMTALVYDAIGLNRANGEGTFKAKLTKLLTLGGLFSGRGKTTDLELEQKYGKLSPVKVDRVPRSWNTHALVMDKIEHRKRKVEEILAERELEEQELETSRYKRRRVEDGVIFSAMS
ncbi:hypothetical protein B0T21DRAFT_279064 [Apiosordaria backusii]|uniref:Uncharacterized protein n=1 Tax=Apiosordaria backusii TaxID=314023 RepID=A0AA40EYN0_9PEZI|nr:hypothetical protein B0T21DRAFT_279064 [Apiosordaria backusii]